MLSNKNIFFSTTSLRRGGKEKQLTKLFAYLQSERKYLITERLNFDENYLSEYKLKPESTIVLGELNFLQLLKKYHSLIKELKPNIIFSWEVKPTVIFLIVYPFHKFILINCSIRHGIRTKSVGQYFRSFVCWISPYIIANSKAGLKANNLKENKRNHILYNGIDLPFPVQKVSLDNRLNFLHNIFGESVSGNTKIFITVANFVPYKDYHTILSALSNVKEKYDFRYLIVGDGPLRKNIEDKILELGLLSKTKLIGKIKNVTDYLEIADYYIHSSKGEGLSNAILEAMFMGLPIIATNTGGTLELVFPKSFRLYDYKNIEQLTDILLNIKNEFRDFDPLSEEYKIHLSKFSFETMTKNFEDIIKAILRNG